MEENCRKQCTVLINIDSWECVLVGNDVSEWFPVNVGLRHGCVMSQRLFNVYMDGVVREVKAWSLGKGWSCYVRMVASLR